MKSARLLPLLVTLTTLPSLHATTPDEEDPHLWLEEVTGEDALAWVEKQNDATLNELTADPRYDEIRDGLLEIYNSTDRIPSVERHGDYYYNFWQDDTHVRGIWRRTTPESYATDAPVWETVLDLDALSSLEEESWVWQDPIVLASDPTRALLHLSRGGKDAVEIREFDLTTNQFVENGFHLPEGKIWSSWIDRDTLLIGTSAEAATTSGYPYIIRRWSRGTAWEDAPAIFTGNINDVGVSPRVSDTASGGHIVIERTVTFFESTFHYVHDNNALEILAIPRDISFAFFHDQLLLELRSDWETGGQILPTGSLITTNFAAFLRGEADWQILFAPQPRVSLDSWSTTRNTVLLNLLDNVNGSVHVLRPRADGWTTTVLNTPAIGRASARPEDSEQNDRLFLTADNFLVPSTLSLVDGGTTTTLKRSPTYFDANGLRMTQHEAIAPDGTAIPYFQVSRADLVLDGSNPTLLYGYGGFQVSMTPYYSGSFGRSWLERGGVYILANIRGGGEFGPAWHQAALKGKRQTSWNDFIAIGEDLVARGVTSPKHLGIMGGSQGGLLMGVMYTQRPDLWGAVVCQVPLLDMLRYHKLLAGASWVGEYGDPDIPEEREFIAAYSPYHNMAANRHYPRILFVTSTHDDRVHPGHARKMAARIDEQGHDFLYWENTEGGHGGAANNDERATLWGLSFTYLWRELGGQD